ncbi:MAG: hypothetical protein HY819_03645 [Acidobacteria bacterium]|nr:hypothetical protein [Acidobacteriota bacterium]
MRTIKLIFSLILIFSLTNFASAEPSRQGKKIGASGSGTAEKNSNTTGKETKPKVIGASGSGKTEDTPTVTKNVLTQPPPPPPPTLSRIAIVTNAPNAEIFINNAKKPYKADDEGIVPQLIDLKPGTVTLIAKHPDFDEQKLELVLEKGKAKTEKVNLISKYGDIKLGGIPEGAQVFIDGEEKTSIAKREGEELTLSRISRGVRKLKITHPDYITREEDLEIKAGELIADANGLVLATADLNLTSTPGAEIYVDAESKGKVLPSGKIVVNGIKPGEREIKVVKDGYEEKKIVQKLIIGSQDLAVKLVPIPNTGEFFEPFNNGLTQWNAPTDWKVDEKAKLHVQGVSKLGYPKKGIFRDLDGQFTVKMLNGKGLAWALRVTGEGKNYYLFHLSGPKGKTPNMMRTYICQDGNLDLSKFAQSIKVNTVTLSPDYFYSIRISVRGNKIETFIKPNQGPEAGTEIPLDVFIDESNTFTYGNIAFTTVDGEETMIDDVGIKPVETEEEKAAKIAKENSQEKSISQK